MSELSLSELKLREEEKRYRAMPALTWQQIADVLTWAEKQLPADQQRNRPRTHPVNSRA